MATRKAMNLEIIRSNIAEAIEELQKLQTYATNGTLSEEEFQIRLLHAYHHLNFSWNIRHVATSRYAALTQRQFEKWGQYPSSIEKV
jgi:hypothetical protein